MKTASISVKVDDKTHVPGRFDVVHEISPDGTRVLVQADVFAPKIQGGKSYVVRIYNFHDSAGSYTDPYTFPAFAPSGLPNGIVDSGAEFVIGLAGTAGPVDGLAVNDAGSRARFKGMLVDVTVTL